MCKFIKDIFQSCIDGLLWLCLIIFSILGGVIGFKINEGYIILGILIGFIASIFFNIFLFGFLITIINIVCNISNIESDIKDIKSRRKFKDIIKKYNEPNEYEI
jgi:TRAP-type C4-dicarboxylate transport system permease small subunit